MGILCRFSDAVLFPGNQRKRAGHFTPISRSYPAGWLDHREKDMHVVSLSNEDVLTHPTDGHGELTGYYKNNVILKIRKTTYLSYGILTINFQNHAII